MGGWSRKAAAAAAALTVAGFAGPAGAEETITLVGGIGYLAVNGDAPVAVDRDPGWAVYGGVRRRINDRWSVQGGIQYGAVAINPRSFFEANDVFLSSPDRHLDGGDLTTLSGTLDAHWEHVFDRTTIGYLKAGVGFHSWTVDPLRLVDAEEIEDQIPDDALDLLDDSGIGGHVGAGLRFPLGDNAGIWGELVIHVVGADGGSLRLTPFRVGVSLP